MEYYLIHDNTGRPFLVILNEDIKVYRIPDTSSEEFDEFFEVYYDKGTLEDYSRYFTQLILTINPYESASIGSNALGLEPEIGEGNTILVHLHTDRYLYIGPEIYFFDTQGDSIIQYTSPVLNNDVPYPFATGTTYVYLLAEAVKVPMNAINIIDPYKDYYDNMELGEPLEIFLYYPRGLAYK